MHKFVRDSDSVVVTAEQFDGSEEMITKYGLYRHVDDPKFVYEMPVSKVAVISVYKYDWFVINPDSEEVEVVADYSFRKWYEPKIV